MNEVPWIDWDAALGIGLRLLPPGPRVSPAEAAQLVADLRRCAARAPELVGAAAQLDASGQAAEFVVDRAGLLRANVDQARAVLAAAGASEGPDGLRDRVGGTAAAAGAAAVLVVLATRILGQFDPFTGHPRLLLAAPNILHTEGELKVAPHDFRMWVCLHEQTHRVQFLNADWLAGHILSLTGELIEAESEADEGLQGLRVRLDAWRQASGRAGELDSSRAASLRVITAISSPRTVAALDRVTAVMSLLEGHADVMMDRAGPAVISSLPTIRARFNRRRRRGGMSAVITRLLGLDAKLAQYADGARFCTTVIGRAGVPTLNLAFRSAADLPTLQEIHHPEQWLARQGSGAPVEPGRSRPDGQA